jgi:hypothetical protein
MSVSSSPRPKPVLADFSVNTHGFVEIPHVSEFVESGEAVDDDVDFVLLDLAEKAKKAVKKAKKALKKVEKARKAFASSARPAVSALSRVRNQKRSRETPSLVGQAIILLEQWKVDMFTENPHLGFIPSRRIDQKAREICRELNLSNEETKKVFRVMDCDFFLALN